MAKMEKVGGMLYIGDTPESEDIPEHDSQIDLSQTIGNAVLAGPITLAATITVTGNLVVV